MAIDLKVPTVGESITEVVIGEWLKSVGDAVEADETVAIIETDKVNVDLLAPKAGVLAEILKEEGDDAKVGEVVGRLEAAAGRGKTAKDEPKDDEAAKDQAKNDEPEADEDAADDGEAEGEDGAKTGDEEPRVTPAARRALAAAGLEAAAVEASGPGGRLLKEDVLRHVEANKGKGKGKGKSRDKDKSADATQDAGKEATKKETPKKEATKTVATVPTSGARQEEVVRMSTLRRRVAERLVQAQQEAALLTTFNEVDMSAVMALRKRYQGAFTEQHGIKLGFMSFFVKAVIEGLKAVPGVNAEIRGDEIVYRNYYDIGVAVGGGKGLVVPVIRNAERLSFAEVEKTIANLAGRARDNKLKLEELQGGTFTISNGGIYGSLLSTPIINPPQSGILGMHKIEERPIALDGEVVIRPMMYLALSYDHRLVDGREAVTFLVRVKERIEDPTRILLEA